MYVVFYGSDRTGVKNKATEFVDKNMPADGTLTSIEGGSFEVGQVSDSLGASSLFGGSEWFVFDGPSENAEFQEEVTSSLSEMSESSNTFVILEGPLLAGPKKIYNKFAADTIEFKADKAERYNAFALAGALADKDKRKLWVLLQEAKLEGLRPEEVVGMFWWQLKTLRLAALTKTAAEAGMKDFPYNKAKRALVKFREGEVEKLSYSLLEVYHDGHAGVADMDNALEQWVLGV